MTRRAVCVATELSTVIVTGTVLDAPVMVEVMDQVADTMPVVVTSPILLTQNLVTHHTCASIRFFAQDQVVVSVEFMNRTV